MIGDQIRITPERRKATRPIFDSGLLFLVPFALL